MRKNPGIAKGLGMYATFVNIDTPQKSVFQSYIEEGLARLSVFVFIPKASPLPTAASWYTTTSGQQPQGLDTNGSSTEEDWQGLFGDLKKAGVEVGFVFGGEGNVAEIGPMMKGLNESQSDFEDFVKTLQSYHVSYLEFDIEGTWDTPDGFADQFEAFAKNLKTQSDGSISIFVGASAPVGEVNGVSSNMPSFVDNEFVSSNNIFFNVYTYYQLEVANVLENDTPWIPTTVIDQDRIAFAVTCNDRSKPPQGQVLFSTFIKGLPDSSFLQKVQEDYLGFFVWIWWQGDSDYPMKNLRTLFGAISED